MKKKLSILSGVALSAALFYLACRRVDFHSLWAILSGIKTAPLALLLITVSAELVIRGVKWSMLLAPAGKVKAADAIRLETAALALNNVLPLRLGEIARGVYGAEFFGISLAAVFATILAEKVLDLAALLTLATGAAIISGVAGYAPGWAGTALAAAAAGIILFISAKADSIAGLKKKHPRLHKVLSGLALGLKALRSPAAAAGVFSLSLLQWLMNALNYYWLALAFGPALQLTLSKSVLLSFTGAAASSAPGMPGYFGSFELAVSAVLGVWGIGADTALAYAVASHIIPYLIITAAGLYFLYRMGQTLGAIWNRFSARREQPSELYDV